MLRASLDECVLSIGREACCSFSTHTLIPLTVLLTPTFIMCIMMCSDEQSKPLLY